MEPANVDGEVTAANMTETLEATANDEVTSGQATKAPGAATATTEPTQTTTASTDSDRPPSSTADDADGEHTKRPRRPSILKKESNSEKHVQFESEPLSPSPTSQPDENNTTSFRPGGQEPLVPVVVVGKKKKTKPNPLHAFMDVSILVAVIACLMYATRDYGTVPSKERSQQHQQPQQHEEAKQPALGNSSPLSNVLNNMANALVSIAAKKLAKKARTEPCDLFLNEGTIPGTGLSIFAGKNYSEGDKILEANKLLPLDLMQPKQDPVSLLLSPHSFLLKDHPERANVQGILLVQVQGKPRKQNINDWKKSTWELRATRPIHEGEELFVLLDMHPRSSSTSTTTDRWSSVYGHIPSAQEYKWAGTIIHDAVEAAHRMQTVHRRRYAAVDADHMYQLTKHVVSMVNPRVGALLPEYTFQFRDRDLNLPTFLTSVPIRSLQHHQNYGSCMDDLRVVTPESSSSSSTASSSTKVVAARNTKKGDVLTVTPVHVLRSLAPNSCVASSGGPSNNKDLVVWCPWADSLGFPISACLTHDSSQLLFCPLTNAAAALIQHAATGEGEGGSVANVEFQWTSNLPKKTTVDELLAIHGGGGGELAWNIVALTDIQAGQEVFVAATSKSAPGYSSIRKIPPGLVSDRWE